MNTKILITDDFGNVILQKRPNYNYTLQLQYQEEEQATVQFNLAVTERITNWNAAIRSTNHNE